MTRKELRPNNWTQLFLGKNGLEMNVFFSTIHVTINYLHLFDKSSFWNIDARLKKSILLYGSTKSIWQIAKNGRSNRDCSSYTFVCGRFPIHCMKNGLIAKTFVTFYHTLGYTNGVKRSLGLFCNNDWMLCVLAEHGWTWFQVGSSPQSASEFREEPSFYMEMASRTEQWRPTRRASGKMK